MNGENSTKSETIGDFPIEIGNSPTIAALVAELKAFLPTWIAGSYDDAENTAINGRKWSLLEQIDQTTIMSKADEEALIWSFEFEAGRDDAFDCEGPGSARSLAWKLVRHIKGRNSAS